MAKKISLSQFRSQMRQAQNKNKQAIDKYNREVRQYNQKVNRTINQYNNEVRKHNARVRANKQKIASELRKLQSNNSNVLYQTVRTSAISLNSYYEILDKREQEFENVGFGSTFLDLSERENANSLEVSNLLESNSNEGMRDDDLTLLENAEISNMLESVSPELNNRWKGALFSLNPNNPDASRHFCTSAREVFIQILEINAPNDQVISMNPSCEKTERGIPTRREKIKFLLQRSGIIYDTALQFVNEDVNNILNLFRVFNDGTHGTSGKFSIDKLMAIKTRIEDGITYLTSISRNKVV